MRRPKRGLVWIIFVWAAALGRPVEAGDAPLFSSREASAVDSFTSEPLSTESASMCPPLGVLPAEFSLYYPPDPPAWYFQAEGLALKRDASHNQTFAALVEREWDEVAGEWVATDFITPVLGTQDLHFNFQGGGRLLLGRTLGACSAFEVCYFEVTDYDEAAAVRDDTVFVAEVDANGNPVTTFPASLFSPFSDFGDPPIIGLDYNKLAQISYVSTLNSLEWNLRRWILADPQRLQASVLVGGRYMEIGERFFYHTESDVPAPDGAVNTATTETGNSMLGVQLGAMFEFFVDPGWWIDCEIKGVAFSNDAHQTTTYINQSATIYDGTHLGRRDETVSSFALDLNLTATMLVTPRFAVRGGYQAVWLDGLVLASENLNTDVNILVSGPPSFFEKGKVVYHGPHLGVSWTW